ncbi:hypothetical protein L6164_023034 [Bauhinia variegata]|uniref:Uncharacterized protein n=1 Tax=Bauhinia variegata TaxID=167791 RepID=A0ACB9MH09_BAUVA|nr:hypothetical protein L6164_023034 [Bauhinia variegata]
MVLREVVKEKFSSPPIPHTEFVMYNFTGPDSSSCFIVEKKNKAEFVERITVTHCFSISEVAVYYVVVKIVTSNKGESLFVEVENQKYLYAVSGGYKDMKKPPPRLDSYVGVEMQS